jgi:hypothetical protein
MTSGYPYIAGLVSKERRDSGASEVRPNSLSYQGVTASAVPHDLNLPQYSSESAMAGSSSFSVSAFTLTWSATVGPMR